MLSSFIELRDAFMCHGMHSENNFELTSLWTVGGCPERKGLSLIKLAGRIPHAWRILLRICLRFVWCIWHLSYEQTSSSSMVSAVTKRTHI
jgi:hypothetical protein